MPAFLLELSWIGADRSFVRMWYWLFFGLLHMNKLVATALAVEVAVLHNFVWHEKFTWRGEPRGSNRDVAMRLARFHAGNGLVSIAGNVVLMKLFSDVLRWNAYLAMGLAIAICALANFAVSELFVFRRR